MRHPPGARDDVLLVRVEQVAERQAVLDPDQAQRGGEAEQRDEAADGAGGRLDLRRRATDEVGDLLRADEHRVDARPLEREHVVAGGGRGGRRSRASRPGRRAAGRGSARCPSSSSSASRGESRKISGSMRSSDASSESSSWTSATTSRPSARARWWSSSRSSSSSCSSTTIRQASAPAAPRVLRRARRGGRAPEGRSRRGCRRPRP